jgi:hypothetical protein
MFAGKQARECAARKTVPEPNLHDMLRAVAEPTGANRS